MSNKWTPPLRTVWTLDKKREKKILILTLDLEVHRKNGGEKQKEKQPYFQQSQWTSKTNNVEKNSKEKDKEKSQEISEISEIAFLASRPNLSMDNYNRTILLEAVNDLVHQLQRHKRQKRIVYNPDECNINLPDKSGIVGRNCWNGYFVSQATYGLKWHNGAKWRVLVNKKIVGEIFVGRFKMSMKADLKTLDDKLGDLLHRAHILVGTTQEESRDNSIHEKLSIRLSQFESYICETQKKNSEIVAENPLETQIHKNEFFFHDENNIRGNFVANCLETLESLQYTLMDINDIKEHEQIENTRSLETEPEFLGIRDLRLVHTMLEIVITWGVYPCLLPGVGVPLSRRTRSRYIQNELLQDLTTEEEKVNNKTSLYSLYCQLYKFMRSLTNIMLSKSSKSTIYTSVSSILFSKYLTDVYGALLQLAYGPLPTKQTMEVTLQIDDNDELERMHKDSMGMFRKVFESADSFQSLEALTVLLGSSPLHPSPKWFKNVCGRFLSQILLRQNGIRDVMDFMIGGESEVNLSKLETISKLILSVPSQVKSVEQYFSVVCPQLLSLVQSTSNPPGNSQSTTPMIASVSAFTIIRMANKYPELSKKFIITKIFNSLWKWWGIASEEFDQIVGKNSTVIPFELDPLIMDEQTLQTTITVIHRILVGSEPVPDLIQMFLEDAIAPLYHLYAFTCSSKSHLKDTIFDILLSYYKIMPVREGIIALKEIVFRKNKKRKAPAIGEIGELYFAPGSSGGVVMRLRLNALNLSDTTTSVDVDVFVNFLKSIANNELSGDFFMYLLSEYTSSLAQQQNYSHNINSRRIFTLLHLVLTMIDGLGSSILQKPGQMISFVNNVLESYHQKGANIEEERKNIRNSGILGELSNIVNDDDVDGEVSIEGDNDDEELLSLALMLLSSLLQEHKNLSIQDLHILNLVFDNLEPLQNHSSSSIQSLVRNLRLTISARNASESSSLNSEESIQRQESLKKYQEAMDALQDEILPIKARGIVMLKEMVLEKDPLMSEDVNLSRVLDIFIQMIQDEESFIYLNAVKGLSSLTDVYGEKIMRKLMTIYSNNDQKIDNRLRIGEAILQTIQRCGEALGKYITTILPPLLHVLNRDQNVDLRVSALSIIGCACETSPLALTTFFRDVVDWVLNILDIQKEVEVRRASIVLLISLFRGLASHSQSIYLIPSDLLQRTYRTLQYIEEIDKDELTRYHARIGISDLDVISQRELFGEVH
ncbi:transport and Golgi organization protein 6 homolog [Rhizophagus clarus]|uniref:Transport and Golgi organization protein 6 homolog n=1 Tax=Rhizophagus clarus TaxID=94130 RepID=A0A8H3LAS9_9GLOM|nr:transport and Golgi organization protein 6 homolog [Rhizophagus clarus]